MGLLDGKVAIITGAGGGLGRAHALLFAKEGAAVVVNDLGGARDGAGGGHSMADQVVKEIQAAGGQAVANYDSVATVEGGESICKSAIDAFGKVDILVNNAGILRDKTLVNTDEASWDIVIQVHLKGTYCVTRPVFTHMKNRGQGGVIVNTSSTSGLIGNFGQSNYGAAKAGIAGFTRCLALEGKKYNIRVWGLAPVAVTRLTEDLPGMGSDAGEAGARAREGLARGALHGERPVEGQDGQVPVRVRLEGDRAEGRRRRGLQEPERRHGPGHRREREQGVPAGVAVQSDGLRAHGS